jgi:hypothetical protein
MIYCDHHIEKAIREGRPFAAAQFRHFLVGLYPPRTIRSFSAAAHFFRFPCWLISGPPGRDFTIPGRGCRLT